MKTIDNEIKNQNLKQIYLLYGDETYLIKQYRDKLKNAIMLDGDEMNYSAFEGKDINQKQIIDLSETMPFFAEHRMILLENTGLFLLDKGSDDDLAEYITSIPETTYLVFIEQSVDKRSKMYKAVKKQGNAVEFAQQKDEVLAKWVGSRVKKEGKGMTQAAYNLFISKTGNDMENIDKELEKLFCYCLDKNMIDATDVEQITTEQIQNKIFDMVDAICTHKQKKAMDMYFDLLALKEPSMKILFMITRQFQLLLKVKSMTNKNFVDKEIATKAGCPEWAVKKYQLQSRGISISRLKEAVRDGIEYEEKCKTGQLNDKMAVELLIVKYSKKDI